MAHPLNALPILLATSNGSEALIQDRKGSQVPYRPLVWTRGAYGDRYRHDADEPHARISIAVAEIRAGLVADPGAAGLPRLALARRRAGPRVPSTSAQSPLGRPGTAHCDREPRPHAKESRCSPELPHLSATCS